MSEREQLTWGPARLGLTWDSSYSAEVGDVYVARRVVRWEAGCALNGNHCSEMGDTPQKALDALHARLTAQVREMTAVCGIRSAEEERAAAVAEIDRRTAHWAWAEQSELSLPAGERDHELRAQYIVRQHELSVLRDGIERGEHAGGGSDGE